MKPVLSQFRTEIRHFYIVSLFNLVFAALAIAFGAIYVIGAVTGLTADFAGPWLRIITGAVAMVCFGLGLSWLLSTGCPPYGSPFKGHQGVRTLGPEGAHLAGYGPLLFLEPRAVCIDSR